MDQHIMNNENHDTIDSNDNNNNNINQEGTQIWIPHDSKIWIKAEIINKSNDGTLKVKILPQDSINGIISNDETLDEMDSIQTVHIKDIAALTGEINNEAIPLCNTFDSNGINDMCKLNHLHEPAVLRNLELRFYHHLPYTYTNQICIAVNPYRRLDIYSKDLYQRYLKEPKESLPPHPFALSSAAYLDMTLNKKEQSILVSGESGAGKTETVKIMMNHLAAISNGGEKGNMIIDKVLKSNPLLESFGNAKTKRNDNSSRFGKFAQLQFDINGFLVGSRCETYLLEKSRLVSIAKEERNYHIFYQIFCIPENERKECYKLPGTMYNYNFLNNHSTNNTTTNNNNNKEELTIDDAEGFKETKDSLSTIGITDKEQISIFKIISSILNLGQFEFESIVDTPSKDNENITEDIQTRLSSVSRAQSVSELLEINYDELSGTLCTRSMTAGTESYSIPLNKDQSADLRDAFVKGIYSKLFDWIVNKMNKNISNTKKAISHIGLLDIFGFETFDINGLEQLCINYANEKLQQKFNIDIFKNVQEEYINEEIPLNLVTFSDNQSILDLIEGKMGIVNLLNEEVLRPTATDSSLIRRIIDTHGEHTNLEKVKFSEIKFLITHYAGNVIYDGNGFLEKNKDTLPTDLIDLLSRSQSKFLKEVFTFDPSSSNNNNNNNSDNKNVRNSNKYINIMGRSNSNNSNNTTRRHRGYLVGSTIAGSFRKQLTELMDIISGTSVQYVRCIKPNGNKKSNEFNPSMVVNQLRYAGVIAAIKISRAAFPSRLSLIEFQKRFSIISSKELRDETPENMIMGLLKKMLSPEDTMTSKNKKFAIGKTKVYFSSGLLQYLEEKRNIILRKYAIMIQKYMYGNLKHKKYIKLRNNTIIFQSNIRRNIEQNKYNRIRSATIMIQAVVKGYLQRKLYKKLLLKYREDIKNNKDNDTLKQLNIQKEIPIRIVPIKETKSTVMTEDEILKAASKVLEAEIAAKEALIAAKASEKLIQTYQDENVQLKDKLLSNLAEFADAELLRENERLKQQIISLQSKLMRAQEVALISAKVVDSRITYRENRQFVEYKLQIETNTRGTLHVWHRYSTFRNLAATLQSKNGYKRKDIPELPSKQLFGNFSEKVIQDRVERLNQFLDAATHADYLQWGIRVDQETCVYKRRVKNTNISSNSVTGRDSVVSSSTASSSPRKSKGFRFSSKSFVGN